MLSDAVCLFVCLLVGRLLSRVDGWLRALFDVCCCLLRFVVSRRLLCRVGCCCCVVCGIRGCVLFVAWGSLSVVVFRCGNRLIVVNCFACVVSRVLFVVV